MAYPTPVNGQITDAVTQSNISVLAQAPAMAMGALYQATAQSLAIAAQNAVTQQQSAAAVSNAVVTRVVSALVPGGVSS